MRNFIYLALLTLGTFTLSAKENITKSNSSHTVSKQLAFNCSAGTAQTTLDINNISTTILNGGDMWWDLSRWFRHFKPHVNKLLL